MTMEEYNVERFIQWAKGGADTEQSEPWFVALCHVLEQNIKPAPTIQLDAEGRVVWSAEVEALLAAAERLCDSHDRPPDKLEAAVRVMRQKFPVPPVNGAAAVFPGRPAGN